MIVLGRSPGPPAAGTRQAHHLVVQQALLADLPQGVVQSHLLLMHLLVQFVELIQRVVQAFIERLPLLLDVRAAILSLLDSVPSTFLSIFFLKAASSLMCF